MKNFIHRFRTYILYLLNAKNEHSLHSPFVYELYTEVIKTYKEYYAFEAIENLRQVLANDSRKITVYDFGAKKNNNGSYSKKIRNIVLTSEKNSKTAAMLFRVVHFLKPKIVIDLGTSLGLTTAYLASAHSKADVYTFEGCKNTLQLAKENFIKLNLKNIHPIAGNIDQTLAPTLSKFSKIDFVFFDANHRYQATMDYFNLCLNKSDENTVFVLDDIYWSPQMTKAWKEIIQDPRVTLSIDLYELGMLFFRKKQPKQHFVLRW
ncbi:MAG: class I SAM-dependent methyltransferase [Cytophagaceae bacterium]|nr:class I SAM-dependent methyltransferase [Cytophagaceae bacterium]MDW8456267.1 class I SAM-dependent methyltransferase [Cytophagaceae bacterium]